jgi:hypothetical protein
MAVAVKIELGLDLGTRDPRSFILDDPTKGLLDSTEYTLSGDRFFDITDRVLSASSNRGKSQALDRIDAGVGSVVVNNADRLFDPLNPLGDYFGQLIPRREIRFSANDKPVITGYIDDFDIAYEPGNNSTVAMTLSDAFSVLAQAELDTLIPPSELAGARINRILNLPEVDWAAEKRNIDDGNTIVSNAEISDGTPSLQYLQLVEQSESGTLFLSKDGNVTFKERNSAPNPITITFSDGSVTPDFTLIPFTELGVVYGSENLYNRIELENTNSDVALAEDLDSQLQYGVRAYNQSGLLVQNTADLNYLANFLLARFKQPQYRFDTIATVLDVLPLAEQNLLLDLEIGDLVQVKFTPSGIPPAVEQYCRVIGISHDWAVDQRKITLSVERLDFTFFILDDPIFGKLDEDQLSY